MKVKAEVRFTNETLRGFIVGKYGTIQRFHEESGISLGSIYKSLAFKIYPKRPDVIQKWEKYLGITIDILFPEEHIMAVDGNLLEAKNKTQDITLQMIENYHRSAIEYNSGIGDDRRETLNMALDKLTEREKIVVMDRHGFEGDEMSFAQIGRKHGVSNQRVIQIYEKALRKLRHPSNGIVKAVRNG